jgi:cytochrome c556
MNKKVKLVALAFGALALGAASVAAQQNEHDHMTHMMTPAPDARQPLDFPPPMRQHMLANMRAHLEALSEILAALSAGDAAKAGAIAKARLGLESAGAAACNPSASGKTGAMGDMAAMMGRHMPEEMRALGYAMHDSASKFALEAANASSSGDLKPALAALAQVTQNCAACHSAYRLK